MTANSLTLKHTAPNGSCTYLAATSIQIAREPGGVVWLTAEIAGGERRQAHDGVADIISAAGITLETVYLTGPAPVPAEPTPEAPDGGYHEQHPDA